MINPVIVCDSLNAIIAKFLLVHLTIDCKTEA